MANTISKKTLDNLADSIQREIESEKKLLEKMTPEERIGYMAAQASFNT